MTAILGMLTFTQLINFLLLFLLCGGYAEDIEKRLAENRTHKELRNLKRQIRQNLPSVRKRILYHFTKGAQWAEREYLSAEMLPPVMPFVRNTLPYLEWISLLFLILGFWYESVLFAALGWSVTVLIWILYFLYQITDKISTRKHFPKASAMEEKIRKQNAFYRNPNHNRNYTPQEWKIIIRAYLLRYSPIGIIFGILADDDIICLFLMGILGLILAVVEEYHRRNKTEVFLCAYQDVSHRRMTPFEHSEAFAERAGKEMFLISILEFVVSGMLLLTGIILSVYS